jgi:hypothetical protein
LGTIAIVLVLSALPATWYHVNVVGPNFLAAMEVQEDPDDAEVRQLEGECGLWNYQISDSSWQAPPEQYDDPMTVVPMYDGSEGPGPNDNAEAVYANTTVSVAAAVFALALGGFGAWNIARHDRYRMFTAASFLLAAILLVGGCVYFSTELPGAMAADAATGHEDAFGLAFQPYIDPEGGEPGYYNEFSGGYPNNDPANREQLEYGAGAGWWLSGAGGVMALITAGMFVGAPQWRSMKRVTPATVEVVRYVPVPTVTDLRPRRRYPRRMPVVSRNSTDHFKR